MKLPISLIAVATMTTSLLAFAEAPSRDAPFNTFSIVAYDADRQEWGVGAASKVLAVGVGVPWAKANCGAIATQSAANTTYGPRGLEMLGKGNSAAEVVKRLTDEDEGRDIRQVGIVDREGKVHAFTGKGCSSWCGEKVGKNYACLGNLLAGKEVVEAMADAFEKTEGRLAWRIMAAMEAGDKAGGDKRGKQSAAILIVREKGGYRGFDDRAVDLRVDDHKEPINELSRILALRFPRKAK
ncbi:MAG: DUF1028 domain-containing protein [Gemmataceae bacterium]|nr:DUF1028 domain-containing protein [Gemmataceae bacterium]